MEFYYDNPLKNLEFLLREEIWWRKEGAMKARRTYRRAKTRADRYEREAVAYELRMERYRS